MPKFKNELDQKRFEYTHYISDHIGNVIYSYHRYIEPLLSKSKISDIYEDEYVKGAILDLGKTVTKHDISKYSEEEFEGYRLKFYPTSEELADPSYKKLSRQEFEYAWGHHRLHNRHHIDYWYEPGVFSPLLLLKIPLVNILEMLCDWQAMSIHFNSNIITWYENDADKEKEMLSKLAPCNTEIIEEFLYDIKIFY